MRWSLLFLFVVATPAIAQPNAKPQAAGNRLAYLDELDPYYPNRHFPKLITPQWVGEDGVEAVVVLAIDDMREPKKYEAFLRPILKRLQKIDGRAPVSIMTCNVDPKDEQLQAWLKEGLSLECHTIDHPCPFFKPGFAKAKDTYDKCVDLMSAVPNSKPVAFRMPCCDSLNTPSPRFWAEIFNKTTTKGNFLTIDSSVFNVFTSDDPELPKELVKDAAGKERFTKYLPLDRSFVNTIENYPYPYVIGKLCWEFPCVTPSDWQAQYVHKPNNPQTVADMKAALDCTVVKKGVYCLVFHPHGWIKNEQIVDLIDHAVAKHGKKVKFLTFKEAQERLDKSLFEGESLRVLRTTPNTVVKLDPLPLQRVTLTTIGVERFEGKKIRSTLRTWLPRGENGEGAWNTRKITIDSTARPRVPRPLDAKRDPDEFYLPWPDHKSQLMIMKNGKDHSLYWKTDDLPFSLPAGANLSDANGNDAGLRFIDLDGDGKLDVIFSNEKEYGIYLFKDMKEGWSRKVMAGKAGDAGALPPIAKHGTNNGFWVHSGQLWWSNEDTAALKDHVDRRSVKELLKKAATD